MSKSKVVKAEKKSVTQYGAKSAPGEGHSFKWPSGTPGEGVGECSHCSCKLKFEPVGPRGGLQRRYWNRGRWSPTEPQCKRAAKVA